MPFRPFVAPALLLALVSLTAPLAWAQPSGDAMGCQPGQGALSFIGCSLAQKLGPAAATASVTVVELKSDRELPSGDALRERVQQAVTRGLRGSGSKPERAKLRVELAIEKSGGVLRVSADLRRATGLWQRILHSKPAAEQHAFVEVPLDAELRALIPPPPLVVSEVLKLKAPERGIVAVSCGPSAADGGQELLLVSRSNLRVGRVAGHRFVERKKAAWSSLSPVAPAPLREAIANAELTPQGTWRVGISDRRDGLELSRELAVAARFEGLFPLASGCVLRDALGVAAQVLPCAGPSGATRSPPATLDAVAGFGSTFAGRDASNQSLVAQRPELSVAGVRPGAQLALGDADSDGAPELLYSEDTLDPARDRLHLVTLQGNKSVPRFDVPVPGISALAICQRREGPGMATLVVASGDELWLLR